MEDEIINKLINAIGSCHLEDVTAIRRLYTGVDTYNFDERTTDYEGVTIKCGETDRSAPEFVRFMISFPLELLGLQPIGGKTDIFTADYCLREFGKLLETIRLEKGNATGKEKYSGRIFIHEPGAKILLRNSSFVKEGVVYISLTIRFAVLMAAKRNVVNGKISMKLVQKHLARTIRSFVRDFDKRDFLRKAAVYTRQQEVRRILAESGYVSFVANGSILPRSDDGGAMTNAVPFKSPPEDEVTLTLSGGHKLTGMAVKEGVTVITGGGYSGKSTLLDAMLHGIYDHIPGDGREYCLTINSACKVIAEDGRCVTNLDISPFIRNVGNLQTRRFTTMHASGSTSQAANIIEALAFGCGAMLVDEDRTATNFMIRDARMKGIIKNDPIVPFTDRVRQIYRDTGVSTVLIIGGSSDYLDLADNVYIMDRYVIHNYNAKVAATRQQDFSFFDAADKELIEWQQSRVLRAKAIMTLKKDIETNRIREVITVGEDEIVVGEYKADISKLDTIVSKLQLTAVAFILRKVLTPKLEGKLNLLDTVLELYDLIDAEGLDAVYSTAFGIDFNMELPALHDVLFALSRMNGLTIETLR
ncbi:MAG: ABC-ATPase domain-containing protein [Defluviitaleaceae bacterium]|nr:ABC-ATPase domain-containing protein [Defluviitaleaceae bacterium]